MQRWQYIKRFLLFLLVENLILLGAVMFILRTYTIDSMDEIMPSGESTDSSTRDGFDIPTIRSTYEIANMSNKPVPTITSDLQKVKSDMSTLSDICEVPVSGFRSWKDGVVTTLEPVVRRNCTRLFSREPREVNKIQVRNHAWRNSLTDEELFNMTKNCSWVVDYFKDNLYMTKLERSFPIAFSFLIHNSPQQVLRLLRFLYRPTNFYCIHPDVKSSPTFMGIFRNIVICLDNVIIPTRLEDVYWGHFSIMEAQTDCLRDLVHIRSNQPEEKKWRYVINLCGKELPLTTTHNMVKHLTKLDGSSAIGAWRVGPEDDNSIDRLQNQTIPYGLTYYKSWTYMAISYDFAHFLLTNKTAINVRHFFRSCAIPEEHFYATVYMIPGVPGGYNPNLSKEAYFDVNDYIWWHHGTLRYPCSGRYVHDICIVAAGDLRDVMRLSQNGEAALFHNKYFMEVDHTVMDCVEERAVAMNRREFESDCGGVDRKLIADRRM